MPAGWSPPKRRRLRRRRAAASVSESLLSHHRLAVEVARPGPFLEDRSWRAGHSLLTPPGALPGPVLCCTSGVAQTARPRVAYLSS